MAFLFGKSEIELDYLGKPYTLKVTARTAVDLERALGMHPITLYMKIVKSAQAGEMPPMGLMAEFFEFMLKRAGAIVDFDELYSQLFDNDEAAIISEKVGELLQLFLPQSDEIEIPKTAPKTRNRKK